MQKAGARATLNDVARQAQVSITSVSRLINHTGPVNEETRLRIEKAMAELGFEPRRSSPRSTAPTLAVLTGDLLNAYFPEVIRGIQEEADSYGMLTMLFTMTDQPQRRQQILLRLSKRVADGVILMGSPIFPGLDVIQARLHLPLVVINRRACGPALGSITVDFEAAGYRAAQHLLMLGHTRIGYISLVQANVDVAIARLNGVAQALRDAGITMQPDWIVNCPPGTEMDGGYYAMSTLLTRPITEIPTAYVCFNDGIAFGVQHAIRAAGFRVPEDFSVVGFDDLAIAAHASPPLTTISQPKYRIGMMAVQMLRKMLTDLSAPGDCVQMETPLMVRESTGPCMERVST